MRLYHHSPCNECPWRKESPPGWLGPCSPEQYADPVSNGEVPACHQQDFGPDSDKTAFCAGSLCTMKNTCKLPSEQLSPGSKDARKLVFGQEACFATVHDFFFHHSLGKKYVLPFMRGLDG